MITDREGVRRQPDRQVGWFSSSASCSGTARWPQDTDQAGRSAEFLKAAGADPDLIPRWVEEGRSQAARPPFGGWTA
jgi:hypothetical protein